MISKKTSVAALVLLLMTPVTFVTADEIGKSLAHKVDVPISDVPPEVLAVARAKRPALTFTEAEKEIRGGRQYFDLEGHDDAGNEIELDMMLGDTGWVVVEIQRDLTWDMVPEQVQEKLHANVPGVTPARIIESDQDNGTIVYEFFTRDKAGKESKYEVSLTGEEAMFLKEEWKH
jgi:hypothetical protein